MLSVVLYCHEVIGAVSRRLLQLEVKRKPYSFGSRNMRSMSVRLNPSSLSKVLNATVNRAISLAKTILSKGSCVHRMRSAMCAMIAVRWL